MFLLSGQEDYSFKELLPMAIIGVIGGLLGICSHIRFFYWLNFSCSLICFKLFIMFMSGALFNQLTLYVTYWRRNYLHKKGNRVKVN